MEIVRANNDSVGHPRYIVHYLAFLNEKEMAENDIDKNYKDALKKAKKIGGKPYRGNDFGGGFVFREYDPKKLEKKILEIAKQ